MYFIRKGKEYFFPKIDNLELESAIKLLSDTEKNIFFLMGNYDKFHSLEVYKKLKKTKLKTNNLYLKLALLHDCGKGNSSIFLRVLHKFGFKTGLEKHSELGYEKIKSINEELAILIKNHHVKEYSQEMSIFQKCDDES